MSTAIGIDLGTTYSCVAVVRRKNVEIIANDQGDRITPSYVAFKDNERLIGNAAKDLEIHNPNNTVYQIKRLIGRTWDDPYISQDAKKWGFNVVKDEDKPKVEVEYKDGCKKYFCPEEISAMILQAMRETAEIYLGRTITDAVITVPAYFNDAQRKATRDAGTIAGLNILAMINEPTAAAIAYGLTGEKTTSRRVLIFDLGGGTFDVTILKIEKETFDVLATGGNSHLGGEDFTNAMVEYYMTKFNEKYGVDISKNKRSISRLRVACEKAKRVLSVATEAPVQVELLCDGIDLDEVITQARFENMNAALFRETIETVQSTLKNSGQKKDQIHEIVLVGGSTRIPKIQRMLKDFFGKPPLRQDINPDEAVAQGAAAQAAVLSSDPKQTVENFVLQDVTPISLGIEIGGEMMSVVVPRNSKIPTQRRKEFQTRHDNQTSVPFHVYEGDRTCIKNNHHLGSFKLTDIPPLPRGKAKFDVCFDIDRDGVLTVTALDKKTGNKANIVISNDRGRLSQNEIERMIAEAERFKEEDKIWKQRSKFINDFDELIHSFQRSAIEHNKKGYLDNDEREKIIEACHNMENYLDNANKDSTNLSELQQAKRDLEGICHPIFGKEA